jgi:AraC-like DNA-binding protein
LVEEHLRVSPRTLRRKLEQEGTSFRELIDELRAHAAIKYVRDTDLTIEDVAYALGLAMQPPSATGFRRCSCRL